MSERPAETELPPQNTLVVLVQRVVTMLIALSLILVVTPLSQFLTMNTVSLDIEIGTPVGWVVGIVFTIVLLAIPVRLISKRLDRANMVLLYAMLTVAVPVMNLGLVRQVYMSMIAISSEYINNGTDTYRTMYNSQSDQWFPKVPTEEGLAWSKSLHVLNLLDDTRKADASRSASRQLESLFKKQLKTEAALTEQQIHDSTLAIQELGADDAKRVIDLITGDKTGKLKTIADEQGFLTALEAQYEAAYQASQNAQERLVKSLVAYGPMDIMALPSLKLRMTKDQEKKFNRALGSLSEDPTRAAAIKSEHEAKVEALKALVQLPGTDEQVATWVTLQGDIILLTKNDRNKVIQSLAAAYLEEIKKNGEAAFNDERNTYMLLLKANERRDQLALGLDPNTGEPNQAIAPLLGKDGLSDVQDEFLAYSSSDENSNENIFTRLSALDQAASVTSSQYVPWKIWLLPILMWTALATVIFLFLMCVAEYLRRKWVERENLAFPQVEIIDHFLRHDAELETADDPVTPKKRKFLPVNLLFVVGLIIGFVFISFDAAFHYDLMKVDSSAAFDVSGQVLQYGDLKSLNTIFFVLSPIVLGIAFLVSLELNLSIFVLFLLYQVSFWAIKNYGMAPSDPLYAGWAGGKSYPFSMEQMLGAMTMFSLLLIWKSLRSGAGDSIVINKNGTFVPRWLFWPGMIVLPILMILLFLSMGMGWSMIIFLGIVGFFFMMQNIAIARARAETGLPTHHVSYEFTKLPLVFGMTGFIGAGNYTRFLSIAFIPFSLLGRSLSQHLENMELARRNKLRYGTLAIGSVLGFVVAVVVGMFSFVVLAYLFGESFYGHSDKIQGPSSDSIGKYPMYVAHFLGENGLDKWGGARAVRIYFILIGAAVYLGLHLLRGRFLKFPLHPLGYMIVLLSIYYAWISPYYKMSTPTSAKEASVLWGSVLVAWVIKKLIIKYGGMNAYKQAKPLFIGLVIGSLLAVFCWNMVDLWSSLVELGNASSSSPYIKTIPYSPRLY